MRLNSFFVFIVIVHLCNGRSFYTNDFDHQENEESSGMHESIPDDVEFLDQPTNTSAKNSTMKVFSQLESSETRPDLDLEDQIYNGNPILLQLAPGIFLNGLPGDVVNLVFLIENRGEDKNFKIIVQEEGGKSDKATHQLFLYEVSHKEAHIKKDEILKLLITLIVPSFATLGTNKTFTIRVVPEGGEITEALFRRFVFTVQDDKVTESDKSIPYCTVEEDTRDEDCKEVSNNPLTCKLQKWGGEFHFVDKESGLRTLVGKELLDSLEDGIYYSYTNFIIGSSSSPANFYFQSNCCINTYSVKAHDVAGNEVTCVAGEGSKIAFGKTEIIITVVVIVLVLIIVIITTVSIILLRRRNAELATMRASCLPG